MTYSFGHGHIRKTVEQKYNVVTDSMTTHVRCVRCNLSYREIDNIGQFHCRMHTLGYSSLSGLFACCNTLTNGCLACDHSQDTENPYPNSCIPPGTKTSCYAFRVESKYVDQLPAVPNPERRVVTTEEDPTALYILRREVKV
jgi:hypothetical protein